MAHVALTSQELAHRREQSQSKTFTAWMNYHLAASGLHVKDLATDLADGIILCRLCEILTGEEIKPNLNPRIRIHRVENANKALAFMKEHKVKMFNIAAEDIVDGNVKMMLALVWGMIRTFQIQMPSAHDYLWEWQTKDGSWKQHNSGLSQRLEEHWTSKLKNYKDLGWAFDLSKMTQEHQETGEVYNLRRRTHDEQPQNSNVNEDDAIKRMLIEFLCEVTGKEVKNLTDNLIDGLVLSKMVEKIHELVHHQKIDLSKESVSERIQTFIDCANDKLQIPALIDGKDLEVGAVDQKAMMLYLSLFKNLYDERKNLESLSVFPEVEESISSDYNLSSLWQDKTGSIWGVQMTDNLISISGHHHLQGKQALGKWVKDEHGKWSSEIEWENREKNKIWLQDADTIPFDNGDVFSRYVDASSEMDASSFWKDKAGNIFILQNSVHGDNKMSLQGDQNVPDKIATGQWVFSNHKWSVLAKWGDQSESSISFADDLTLDLGNGEHLTRYFPEISTYIDLNGKWKDSNGKTWKLGVDGNELDIVNTEDSSHGKGIWYLEDNLWSCPVTWSDNSEGEIKLIDADTLSVGGLTLTRDAPILSSEFDLNALWVDTAGQLWSLENKGNYLTVNGTGAHQSTSGQGEFHPSKSGDGSWEALVKYNDRPEVQMKLTDKNTIHLSDGNKLTRQIAPPLPPPPAPLVYPVQERAQPMGGAWENGVYVISNGVGYNSSPAGTNEMSTLGGRSFEGRTTKKGGVGFIGKGKDMKNRIVRESKHAYRTTTPIHDSSMHARFNRAFKFSAPEPLYLEFPCKFASSDSTMMIGYAYVTRNFFCFCGANGRDRLSVILPLDEISKIQAGHGGVLNNYSRCPKIHPVAEGHKANAILITDVNGRHHRFYSVDDIDKAIKIFTSRWHEACSGHSIQNTVSPVMEKFGTIRQERDIQPTDFIIPPTMQTNADPYKNDLSSLNSSLSYQSPQVGSPNFPQSPQLPHSTSGYHSPPIPARPNEYQPYGVPPIPARPPGYQTPFTQSWGQPPPQPYQPYGPPVPQRPPGGYQ